MFGKMFVLISLSMFSTIACYADNDECVHSTSGAPGVDGNNDELLACAKEGWAVTIRRQVSLPPLPSVARAQYVFQMGFIHYPGTYYWDDYLGGDWYCPTGENRGMPSCNVYTRHGAGMTIPSGYKFELESSVTEVDTGVVISFKQNPYVRYMVCFGNSWRIRDFRSVFGWALTVDAPEPVPSKATHAAKFPPTGATRFH